MLQLFIAIMVILFLVLFIMLSMPMNPDEDDTPTQHTLVETTPPQS
jgi:preprotein translocase subunit SecG